MNRYDALDPDVSSWLDAEARAPVPVERRDRALDAIAAQRPRPAVLARIGSHWVAEPSPIGKWLDRRGFAMPAVASTSTIVLLVVALALLGAALIVGGRLLQPTPFDGRLLYVRNGDLYLAEADGRNPVKVGPGGIDVGSTWAPDGRHFTYWGYGDRGTSDFGISDADGRIVGAYLHGPGMAGGPVWSPDSTRIARWTHEATMVSIHAIDGSILAELTPPVGYTNPALNLIWAPDGRSVWVSLCPAEGGATADGEVPPPCANPDYLEHWELPLDGSAPRRVLTDLASFEVSGLTFSPDGTRLAFVAREAGTRDDHVLYVAEPDGSNRTPVIHSDDGPSISIGHLAWSPGSDAIAYRNQAVGGRQSGTSQSVKVVDIATGTARTLVPNLDFNTELLEYGWSPDGTRLLLSGGPWRDSLWTVSVDGGEPVLLLEDARAGEWQPVSIPEERE